MHDRSVHRRPIDYHDRASEMGSEDSIWRNMVWVGNAELV